MGRERCGRVRGVGFGPTPTGRSGANLPCLTGSSSSETAHRMTELENSLMDQLAQSEQRHQEAIAALHAQHKEEIAKMWAESDARHEQQMAKSKWQMDECLGRESHVTRIWGVCAHYTNCVGTKNVAFNIFLVACLLQCIVMYH